jgi:hypothetical protein
VATAVARYPGDSPHQRIVGVPASLAELAADRDREHRHHDDQDLDAEKPDALRDERERGASHDEQQRGQRLGGAGREKPAALSIRSRLMETATHSSPVRAAAAAMIALKNGSQ